MPILWPLLAAAALAGGATAVGATQAGTTSTAVEVSGAVLAPDAVAVPAARVHGRDGGDRRGPRPAAGGGDLAVSIPLTNTGATLHRACHLVLDTPGDEADRGRPDVAGLVAETGGSLRAAAAWCRGYLGEVASTG